MHETKLCLQLLNRCWESKLMATSVHTTPLARYIHTQISIYWLTYWLANHFSPALHSACTAHTLTGNYTADWCSPQLMSVSIWCHAHFTPVLYLLISLFISQVNMCSHTNPANVTGSEKSKQKTIFTGDSRDPDDIRTPVRTVFKPVGFGDLLPPWDEWCIEMFQWNSSLRQYNKECRSVQHHTTTSVQYCLEVQNVCAGAVPAFKYIFSMDEKISKALSPS